jgi:hypothetical protein
MLRRFRPRLLGLLLGRPALADQSERVPDAGNSALFNFSFDPGAIIGELLANEGSANAANAVVSKPFLPAGSDLRLRLIQIVSSIHMVVQQCCTALLE